ncbi:Rieske 2Fe-2S domain-containing protein [Cohnella silvisoli]|uniref:Rieske 2Fe-2S domain-containing protein n=1 Tax=Cohnella silvisoli TaxID=2873699 RepID=A0ABV1L1Q1_9BACL|nr:Rieske 2Fe-2S domain-containing protein [Cohnella silvisoli]
MRSRDLTFAVYRSADSRYYATDGYCTHEKFRLANGLVMGNTIERPKHNGSFDYTSVAAKRAPCALPSKLIR